MNILSVFIQWYILMGMCHEKDPAPWRHSHIKFHEELEEYYKRYTSQLSMKVREKVLEHAICEANYSFTDCEFCFEEKLLLPEHYSQKGIISSLSQIFSKKWELCMGGEAWGSIIETCKIDDDELFLDSIVDISHNSNLLIQDFDWPFEDTTPREDEIFALFLDLKYYDNIETIYRYFKDYISYEVKSFYKRRCNLIGVNRPTCYGRGSLDYQALIESIKNQRFSLYLESGWKSVPEVTTRLLFMQEPCKYQGEPLPKIIFNHNYHCYYNDSFDD